MEPLTGKTTPDVPPADSDNVDRIVLRRAEQKQLEGWMRQLNTRFEGMIKVTKSDLANFLIRSHNSELSEDEITQIEIEQYDEVRWLNWALAQIRESKRQGLSLTLDELIARRCSRPSEKKTLEKTSRRRATNTSNKQSPIKPDMAQTAPVIELEEKDFSSMNVSHSVDP